MADNGTLYLIPNTIAAGTADEVIHLHIKNKVKTIRYFLAEDVRSARRFISTLKIFDSVEPLQFSVLNKNTDPAVLEELLKPLMAGENMGIITESGCPGIADPGALAVAFAHNKNIRVVPMVGPSSLLLALMASGLNGQHFAFHGYLPVDKTGRKIAIEAYEKESRKKNLTQLFIETPYRNNQLFQSLIENLSSNTLLCVATDITGQSESIKTKTVADWRKTLPGLPKLPTVFLFLAR